MLQCPAGTLSVSAQATGQQQGPGRDGADDAHQAHGVGDQPSMAEPAPCVTYTAEDPVRAVLADIARDALSLATSPALELVRTCAGSHCAVWFLDTSRPGNRRWCSMETCGNQAKKSTWRTRLASAEAITALPAAGAGRAVRG